MRWTSPYFLDPESCRDDIEETVEDDKEMKYHYFVCKKSLDHEKETKGSKILIIWWNYGIKEVVVPRLCQKSPSIRNRNT